MISKDISKSILTIGCEYKSPKGGIAQIIYTYKQYLFSDFRCVVNSGGNNKLVKLYHFIFAYIHTFYLLLFDKTIRIIHIHTASNISFYRSSFWVTLAKMFNRKVILHIHGGGFKDYYKTNPKWIQSVLDKCDCIIALSKTWGLYFTNELHYKNVCVVKNVIPNPIKKDIKKDDHRLHLLFLGLITEEKGIFDFLQMIAHHKEHLCDKIMLHIGGNGKIEELNRLIDFLQLKTCVEYEGFVAGEEKVNLLNIADVFVLPSYIEGLPISILEAMSYSMPILSTSVGGIPEIVSNAQNGYLFTPGDETAMYSALMSLISNPQYVQQMGQCSRNIVKEYLPDNVELQLEKVYKDLM